MTEPKEFIVTSRVQFADGSIEGQVFHAGDKKSCDQVAQLIPALAYCGDKIVVSSCVLIAPNHYALQAGECWSLPSSGDTEPEL